MVWREAPPFHPCPLPFLQAAPHCGLLSFFSCLSLGFQKFPSLVSCCTCRLEQSTVHVIMLIHSWQIRLCDATCLPVCELHLVWPLPSPSIRFTCPLLQISSGVPNLKSSKCLSISWGAHKTARDATQPPWPGELCNLGPTGPTRQDVQPSLDEDFGTKVHRALNGFECVELGFQSQSLGLSRNSVMPPSFVIVPVSYSQLVCKTLCLCSGGVKGGKFPKQYVFRGLVAVVSPKEGLCCCTHHFGCRYCFCASSPAGEELAQRKVPGKKSEWWGKKCLWDGKVPLSGQPFVRASVDWPRQLIHSIPFISFVFFISFYFFLWIPFIFFDVILFIESFTHSFIHFFSLLFTHLFVHSFTSSLTHLLVHSWFAPCYPTTVMSFPLSCHKQPICFYPFATSFRFFHLHFYFDSAFDVCLHCHDHADFISTSFHHFSVHLMYGFTSCSIYFNIISCHFIFSFHVTSSHFHVDFILCLFRFHFICCPLHVLHVIFIYCNFHVPFVYLTSFHFTHSMLFTGILFSAASSIFTVMSVMIVICHFVFIHVVSFHFTHFLFMSLHTVRKSIHQPANQPINQSIINYHQLSSTNHSINQPCSRWQHQDIYVRQKPFPTPGHMSTCQLFILHDVRWSSIIRWRNHGPSPIRNHIPNSISFVRGIPSYLHHIPVVHGSTKHVVSDIRMVGFLTLSVLFIFFGQWTHVTNLLHSPLIFGNVHLPRAGNPHRSFF